VGARDLELGRHLLRHRQVTLAAVVEWRQLDLELVAVLLARTELHLTKAEARHATKVANRGRPERPNPVRKSNLVRYPDTKSTLDRANQVREFLVVAAVVGEVDRADPGDDRLLRALVQPLAAAAHRDEELVEVRLERCEHPVCPVLHLEPHLPGLPA